MSTAGKFSKIDKLGEGTYGVVYKARERSSGTVFALKRMNIPAEEEGVPATAIREIALQKQLTHPNIVRLHDVLFQPPKLTLVFEYCDYDLKKFMDANNANIPPHEIQTFMRQLLNGIDYMHQRSVVHRDLKPQNLMITESRVLKIGDFGLARVEGIAVKKYSHDAVTLWYRSPDAILGSANYGLPIDLWSVGCIFAELALGKPLFNGRSDHDQLQRMFTLLGSPNRQTWPGLDTYPGTQAMFQEHPNLEQPHSGQQFTELANTRLAPKMNKEGVDLLKQLLALDPQRRPTAAQALEHPYFALQFPDGPAPNGPPRG